MTSAAFLRELFGGVEDGIYLPPQFPGGLFQQGNQFDHCDRTDDEQVNVAAGGFSAVGNRTINHRHFDFGGERGQFAMKDIHQTRRFEQKGAQFGENRACLVRLKIGAVPASGHFKDASLRIFCQIPLQAGWPHADIPGQFRRIYRLMRIQKQGGQQPLLGAGKKNTGDGRFTHYAYNKTQNA